MNHYILMALYSRRRRDNRRYRAFARKHPEHGAWTHVAYLRHLAEQACGMADVVVGAYNGPERP